VEGRQAVRELLAAGRRAVREVWIAEGVEPGGTVAEIAALAADARVPVRSVPRSRLDATALTDAPQGVVAFAEPVAAADLSELLWSSPEGNRPFLVVLDGVTDPHNVGALLRSALGAGATGAVIPRHRAARLGPSALKASAGAVEYLPVALVAGIPAALSELQAAGVWIVGLDGAGRGLLWDLPVATEPVAPALRRRSPHPPRRPTRLPQRRRRRRAGLFRGRPPPLFRGELVPPDPAGSFGFGPFRDV
jgi:23S rRNA (guanosine2251-2'-O)-methyltransferase